MEAKSEIDKAINQAYLDKKKVDVKGDMIENVATISTKNDKDLGKIIGDAFRAVGETGVVMMEPTQFSKTEIDVVEVVKYDKGIKNYTKAIEKLNKSYNITKGMKKEDLKSKPMATTGPEKGMTGKKLWARYKEDRINLSGVHLLNEIMPVIYDWFTGNENNKKTKRLNTKVLQKFIEYVSSRSPQSGKFVIAK